MAVRSRSVPVTMSVTMAGGLLMLGALVACTRAAAPQPSAAPASSTPASSPKPTPSQTTKPAPARATVAPTLGGQCDDLLPVSTINQALGRPVIGTTSFIRGVAEPNIGRLTYLNCRYGLAFPGKQKQTPTPVEIGVSLYKSSAQASKRVQGTVEDYLSHGARQQKATVGSDPASILLGYGRPTIVVASGPRTVAVTADSKVVSGSPDAGLIALAKTALVATSHFDGVAGVVATPSPSATPS